MSTGILVMIDRPTIGQSGPGDAIRVLPADQPALRATVLAATRGDGIFETAAIRDGRVQAAGAHLARFARSAAMLDLPAPDPEVYTAAIERGIALLGDATDAAVKYVLTRGDEEDRTVGPIGWALSTSLKATNRIFAVPPQLIPSAPTLEHYRLLVEEGVQWAFLNSASYAVAAVFLALLLGTAAGYALARYPVPNKNLVLVVFVGAMAVPGFAVLLPTQILFVDIGIYNTYVALPLLYAGHILPFAVWVTRLNPARSIIVTKRPGGGNLRMDSMRY